MKNNLLFVLDDISFCVFLQCLFMDKERKRNVYKE